MLAGIFGQLLGPRSYDVGGGGLLPGGNRRGERLFQRTVVMEAHWMSLLSQQEVFGPVSTIYRFLFRLRSRDG